MHTSNSLLAALLFFSFGCGLDSTDTAVVGSRTQSLAHAGKWQIPTDVSARGDEHETIDYVGAGPWVGESGCSGGMEPGTVELRDYLYKWFPATHQIGGYSCRSIVGSSGSMSLHATGRALDIMIPLAGDYSDDTAADNDLGDPIGNWLIENAEDIGIQYIIWDQWTWGQHREPGQRDRSYGGTHPHHDHLHVELTPDAAAGLTAFFEGPQDPPTLPACAAIPPSGAVIDDTDPCVQIFGNADLWRRDNDRGYGGSLRWTNAFDGARESNWARFVLDFEARGDYEVLVHLDPERSVHSETRYAITHAEGITEVILDQSAGDGWTSLGFFPFAAGTHQDVLVFDNTDGPVAEQQHITLDAIQLVGSDKNDDPTPPTTPTEGELPDDSSGVIGGCRASGGTNGTGVASMLLGFLLLGRRRRRRRG